MTPERAGELCDELDKGLRGSETNLSVVASAIVVVLREQAWRERRVRTGEIVKCNSFLEMLTSQPLKGYGEDPKRVESLLRDDPEALALFREATTAPSHRPAGKQTTDNISTFQPEHGTSRAYTLTRLKRQRPDLYQQVAAGEMSANAAAIEAGFRRKLDPADQVRKLWAKLTADERLAFLRWAKTDP